VLIAFVGGVGTLIGPVLGAVFYIVVREQLAITLSSLTDHIRDHVHSHRAGISRRAGRHLDTIEAIGTGTRGNVIVSLESDIRFLKLDTTRGFAWCPRACRASASARMGCPSPREPIEEKRQKTDAF